MRSRKQQAALTRRKMLTAAYDLFCKQGFRATTMEAIATRAGVAVQTIYFTFHTKDALLQEVHDWTVLGDDPTPPPQQDWYQGVVAEPDPQKATEALVEGTSTILARVAPMMPVFHAVTGDDAGQVFRHAERLRRDGYHLLAKAMLAKGGSTPQLSPERASDLLFVLLGPEIYRSFVHELQWTQDEWAGWTVTALMRDLFAPQTVSAPHTPDSHQEDRLAGP